MICKDVMFQYVSIIMANHADMKFNRMKCCASYIDFSDGACFSVCYNLYGQGNDHKQCTPERI